MILNHCLYYIATHHRATGCPDEKPRLLVRTTANNDVEPSSSTNFFPNGPVKAPALWNLGIDRRHAVNDVSI